MISSLQQQKMVRAWRNWRRGLFCCLPPGLRRLADPRATPWILELEPDNILHIWQDLDDGPNSLGRAPLDALNAAGLPLKQLRGPGKRLVLRLPAARALLKRARFPAATEENLRQVIGFEMDRLTPFPVDQVQYDYQVIERDEDSGELTVELAVVPRRTLEAPVSALQSVRLEPAAVDTVNGWEEMNLLSPAERPGGSRLGLSLNITIWLLVICLLAAVLITPLYQQRQIAIELERRANAARKQATQVTTVRNQVEQARTLLESVPKRREELPSTVMVMRELVNLFPDDTWVQQFELKQGKLELRGLSRQATALIQVMENSPTFRNVGFRSPVLQAQGDERFHLSADLLNSESSEDPLAENDLASSGL